MAMVGRTPCSCGDTTTLERLRYFPRQLLTADDMRAEQEYFREKQRRHNRLLHGWGIVCGLEVVLDKEAGSLAVQVCPGFALGPFGDEIDVPQPVKLDLTYCAHPSGSPCNPPHAEPEPETVSPLLVAVRYVECATRPTRTLPAGCGCDETACEYSRTRDGFEVRCIVPPKGGAGHEEPAPPTLCEIETHKQIALPKCPSCASDPWVPLALITPVSNKKTGAVGLGADSIDNSVRQLVHSTGAIQRQVIACCCGI